MQQSRFIRAVEKSFGGNKPVEQENWTTKSSIEKINSCDYLTLRRVQSNHWFCVRNGLSKAANHKRLGESADGRNKPVEKIVQRSPNW